MNHLIYFSEPCQRELVVVSMIILGTMLIFWNESVFNFTAASRQVLNAQMQGLESKQVL